MKFTYLLIDFFTILIPFCFSFHPKINFYKKWKYFFTANSIISIIFISWDIVFTNLKVWWFNPKYISEIYFFDLPLEEVLFFICIPFACVFTYHCLNLFFKIKWNKNFEQAFIALLSLVLIIAGIYYHTKLYTSSTFISLAIILITIKFLLKVNWLSKLFSIYPVLLLPFFVVNGILTGSGLQQPVVLYNDAENMGIRLFTIPLEDSFYGFELILLNVFLYEFFLKRSKQKNLS